MSLPELRRRVDERIDAWRVRVERVDETESSVLVFGYRDDLPVVVKVVKEPREEWRAGEVLEAFEGRGVVRVYDHVDGAMLLERPMPGSTLEGLALEGRDDEATHVIARTIASMSPRATKHPVPTVEEWGRAFERYERSGDARVPGLLRSVAHRLFRELCRSQGATRLLHGDLHHANVVLHADRGWLAIDPKGVVGEIEYEVGAALRNPYDSLARFADPSIVRRRVDCFAGELGVDGRRLLGWAFAQSVLAAIWGLEDGLPARKVQPWIGFAGALQPMVAGTSRS